MVYKAYDTHGCQGKNISVTYTENYQDTALFLWPDCHGYIENSWWGILKKKQENIYNFFFL